MLAREIVDPKVPRQRYLFFPLASSFLLSDHNDKLTGNINSQNQPVKVVMSRERPWHPEEKMSMVKCMHAADASGHRP